MRAKPTKNCGCGMVWKYSTGVAYCLKCGTSKRATQKRRAKLMAKRDSEA